MVAKEIDHIGGGVAATNFRIVRVEGCLGLLIGISLSQLLVRKMCTTLQGDSNHIRHPVSFTISEVGLFGDLFEEIEVAANALTPGYNNVTNNMIVMATSTSPLQSNQDGKNVASINLSWA
uniref:Uncharacterized protein n=1 Tax=Tanacetum cinerariifolium TaxID=118510 RepID=A0A6L2LT75_TANCI|nr:hypothetical protein [Tanacetum cinerariifolium]